MSAMCSQQFVCMTTICQGSLFWSYSALYRPKFKYTFKTTKSMKIPECICIFYIIHNVVITKIVNRGDNANLSTNEYTNISAVRQSIPIFSVKRFSAFLPESSV